MKIRKPVGPSDRCGVSNAEKIFGSRGACAPLLLSPFIIPIIRKSREFTLRQALSYCLLNLALGGYTQPLEKLADAGVENVFVHRRLHVAACCWPAATLERGAVPRGSGFI